ncbi:MAG: ATP-binding protein, partial [Bacteroidota bacterium]
LVGTPVITEDLGPEDHIMSVRSYVEEILYRLLHNAWLYRSPEREPDIRVSLRKESGQYFIEVSDNGLGIDPKNWEQIFEPYKRLTYTSAGRGLGLYLARAQAQAIKGTLSVESNPGVGSVFHLVLPDPVVREVKTT